MTYKTLMLKIFKPSKRKQRIMDAAIERYAAALQYLLDTYRDKLTALAESSQPVSRPQLLRLLEKDVLKQMNAFEAQPFKDSVKIEFAALAMNYIAHRKKNGKASFPRVNGKEECGAALHPLYFGRYAVNRDYCLLIDRGTGRFYAKLYLKNAKNKIDSDAGQSRLQLQYLSESMPDFLPQPGAKRFLVLPLAFGKYQLQDLNRLLEFPKLTRTARLKKIKGEYYLLVNIACMSPNQAEAETTMGISRCMNGNLHFTVCDGGSRVIETGVIGKKSPESQKLYLLAKSVLAVCEKHHSQLIVESNGGRNDKLSLKMDHCFNALTTVEYSKLVKILNYKLEELGLPRPIELSANRLYTTCPSCNHASQKSRISSGLFVCVNCGYASSAEAIGSINLIRRLHRYKNDRVPIVLNRFENKMVFLNKTLEFECTIPPASGDYTQMYYELNRFIHLPNEEKMDSRKYAVIQKLKQAPDITEAISIIDKNAVHKSRMF